MPNHHRPADWSPSGATAMRVGATVLGMFAGAALGLTIALVILFGLEANTSLSFWVFGGAGLGGAVGFVTAEAGFALAEGVVHFFVGLASSQVNEDIHPNHDAPTWLKRCLWLGLFVGVGLSYWWVF
jgi:hypothetical protein